MATTDHSSDGPVARGRSGLWPIATVHVHSSDNKAPGPNDFPTEFYQVLWVLIKIDLMALFSEFHMGNLLLYRLNFRTIILLPKCVEALMIQQYRPTYLLNVSFKIFMKVIIAHGSGAEGNPVNSVRFFTWKQYHGRGQNFTWNHSWIAYEEEKWGHTKNWL
jgi:hypothetical protein